MPEFPKLKTGAVAQYPARRDVRYSNQVLRFVDGAEQRFRSGGGSARRWRIALDLLDETELGEMEQFFREQQGEYGSFSFTDPWDGLTYANCSFEADTARFESVDEMQGRTTLTIRENRT